jgi:hypothetical protein
MRFSVRFLSFLLLLAPLTPQASAQSVLPKLYSSVGHWTTYSYWFPDGKFSHCWTTDSQEDYMGFSQSPFGLRISFGSPHWRLQGDRAHDLSLSIDRGKSILTKADAISNVLILDLRDVSNFETAISGAKSLSISVGTISKTYSLKSSSQSIDQVSSCYEEFKSDLSSNPFLFDGGSFDNPFDKTRTMELPVFGSVRLEPPFLPLDTFSNHFNLTREYGIEVVVRDGNSGNTYSYMATTPGFMATAYWEEAISNRSIFQIVKDLSVLPDSSTCTSAGDETQKYSHHEGGSIASGLLVCSKNRGGRDLEYRYSIMTFASRAMVYLTLYEPIETNGELAELFHSNNIEKTLLSFLQLFER